MPSNMSSQNSKQTKPFKTSKFDIKHFSVSDFVFPKKGKGQKDEKPSKQFNAFPRYKGNNCHLKTGDIKLTQYGFKKLDEQYITDDSKRNFLRVPLDPEQENCVNLRTMCEAIDAWAVENKELLFQSLAQELKKKPKKVAKMYNYTPLVRKPYTGGMNDADSDSDDDDDDDDAKNAAKDEAVEPEEDNRMDYIKAMYSVEYDSGGYMIDTPIFMKTPRKGSDKFDITQTDQLNTPTILESKGLKWTATINSIFSLCKMWAQKVPDKSGKCDFGFGIKIIQQEFIPAASTGQKVKEAMKTYALGDSDDDSDSSDDDNDEDETSEKTAAAKIDAASEDEDASDDADDASEDENASDDAEEDEDDNEDEDDDDDEEEEESEEEAPPPVKASKKKKSTSSKASR